MENPHLVGEEGRKVIVLVAGQDDKRVLKLGASVTTGPLSLLRLSFFNITAVLPRLRCPYYSYIHLIFRDLSICLE